MHGGAAGSGAPIGNQNARKREDDTQEALAFAAELRELRAQMRKAHKEAAPELGPAPQRLRPSMVPIRYRRLLEREGYSLDAQLFVGEQMMYRQLRKGRASLRPRAIRGIRRER